MSVIGILAIAACWVAICEVLVWLYQLDLPEPHAEIGDFSSSLTRVSCCRCAKSTRRQGDKATRRQGDKATRKGTATQKGFQIGDGMQSPCSYFRNNGAARSPCRLRPLARQMIILPAAPTHSLSNECARCHTDLSKQIRREG
jgi:hypothetical protein